MSNISINQASKLFKISRNTIYARIKKGDMTKNIDGLVSVQDMMRLFGNKSYRGRLRERAKSYAKALANVRV